MLASTHSNPLCTGFLVTNWNLGFKKLSRAWERAFSASEKAGSTRNSTPTSSLHKAPPNAATTTLKTPQYSQDKAAETQQSDAQARAHHEHDRARWVLLLGDNASTTQSASRGDFSVECRGLHAANGATASNAHVAALAPSRTPRVLHTHTQAHNNAR